MGEYFYPVICSPDWSNSGYLVPRRFGAWWDYDSPESGPSNLVSCGAKILEHGNVGSHVVDAVGSFLSRRVCCIAWLGDYTNPAQIPSKVPKKTYDEIWQATWSRDRPSSAGMWCREYPVPCPHEPLEKTWLVNWDKEQAVRMPGVNEDIMKMSPLPVLTTTDGVPGYEEWYKDFDVPQDVIGSWAWDRLSTCDVFPENFKELRYNFGTD